MSQAKYLVYRSDSNAVTVKVGFSWPAFLLGSFWAAANRMWRPYFFALLAVDMLIWVLTGYAEVQGDAGLAGLSLLASIAYAVVRGRQGNRWLERSLLSKGYALRPSLT